MNRAWLLLVVAALAGGIWWWQRTPAGTAPVEAARPVTVAPVAPPPLPMPVTPMPAEAVAAPIDAGVIVVEPVAPPAPASVPYEAEVRDPAWARDQERELALRLDRVTRDLATRGAKVTIGRAECRHSLCKVDVEAAGADDLSKLYGALETPDGLYGWADTVVLGQVDGDMTAGKLTTSITVAFERE